MDVILALFVLAVVVALLALAYLSARDVARYLRIRRM
jgi:hypothetical protein